MIIGITGTLASGKSSVAKLIADTKGAELLDADKIAHAVLEQDKDVHLQLVSTFGEEILNKKNKINRKSLASVVFSDRAKLKKLCSIVHPRIISKLKLSTKDILSKDSNATIVMDAPLLLEVGMGDFCDLVIVVTTSIANILARAGKHHGFKEKEALKRIRAQIPISEKKKYADYIIENNGTIEELKNKVKQLTERIKK